MLAGFGGRSIVVVLIAVLLLDVGTQGSNVLGQTRLMSVEPQIRSRLNTTSVTGNFLGGTIGSALASALWQSGG